MQLLTRRETVLRLLFGAQMLGLRSLASGIPVAVLANPRRALAWRRDAVSPAQPQFLILNTSYSGDPLNCNVPGTYDDPKITHPADPAMAPTTLSLGNTTYRAALPWTQLPANVLARTCFFHHSTNTVVHGQDGAVLSLQGAVVSNDMLVSRIAFHVAPNLNTLQTQPISLVSNSAEAIYYQGGVQPQIPPTALKAALGSPTGPLGNLSALRDRDLDQINQYLKANSVGSRATFIDHYATSQSQLRMISQDIVAQLNGIHDDSVTSQVTAAVLLLRMRMCPVVSLNIPFGGDNHYDAGLAIETAQTLAGVAAIASLMAQLQSANLQDSVTFASLNVFGRNMGPGNNDGRGHNAQHHCGLIIGPAIQGSVIGAVAPLNGDYGATAIDSVTGAGGAGGDIAYADGLTAFGLTLAAAAGVSASALAADVRSGTAKVVQAALRNPF